VLIEIYLQTQLFEGFTYFGRKMIGTDVLCDLPTHQSYTSLNFIVDPVNWAVITYTGEDADGNPYGTAPLLFCGYSWLLDV
jgi:hypothetical protein